MGETPTCGKQTQRKIIRGQMTLLVSFEGATVYAARESLVKQAWHSHRRVHVMDKLPTDNLQSLLAYLESANAKLLANVQPTQLNQFPADGGWSQGQVVAHLIRTEQYLYPVFAWLPRLARVPWLVRGLDGLNLALCKLAGVGFVSLGDQLDKSPDTSGGTLRQLNPQFRGRFRAPAFLKPGRNQYDWQTLLLRRTQTRGRTLAALQQAPFWQLQTVRFSHPELGTMTLLEFVLFLGKHEEWHAEQLTRIWAQFQPLRKEVSATVA